MSAVVAILYSVAVVALFLYGLNAYHLLAIHWWNRRRIRQATCPDPPTEWPSVTVQLPLYNERYVARRLLEAVGTDLFAYHGYVEIMPRKEWIKATPTFNVTLCEKLGVPPLAFSGDSDALLQPFDSKGREFMSYVTQHGTFFDVPAKFLIGEMKRLYPKLCQPGGLRGDMEAEGRKGRS